MAHFRTFFQNTYRKIRYFRIGHNLIICILIACSILSFLIPLVLIQDKKEGLELGIDLISVITTFLTFLIALLLFDKFGIRKRVIDYQTDSIIKLIEELRKTLCILKGEKVNYMIWFTRDLTQIKHWLINNNEDKKLVIFHHGQNIMLPKNIESIMNDLWLPKPIRKKMEFLDFNVVSIMESEKPDKQRFIVAEFENENQDMFFYKEELTPIQFIEYIEELIRDIKNWLEAQASIRIDLNIRPKSE